MEIHYAPLPETAQVLIDLLDYIEANDYERSDIIDEINQRIGKITGDTIDEHQARMKLQKDHRWFFHMGACLGNEWYKCAKCQDIKQRDVFESFASFRKRQDKCKGETDA